MINHYCVGTENCRYFYVILRKKNCMEISLFKWNGKFFLEIISWCESFYRWPIISFLSQKPKPICLSFWTVTQDLSCLSFLFFIQPEAIGLLNVNKLVEHAPRSKSNESQRRRQNKSNYHYHQNHSAYQCYNYTVNTELFNVSPSFTSN